MSKSSNGIYGDDYYLDAFNDPLHEHAETIPSSRRPTKVPGSLAAVNKLITPSILNRPKQQEERAEAEDYPNPEASNVLHGAYALSCSQSSYDTLHPDGAHWSHAMFNQPSNQDEGSYWMCNGKDTSNALSTEAAWRNRFRESGAKTDWRRRIEDEVDRDRRERRLAWTIGYTGHIPRLRAGFGVRNSVVSNGIFSSTSSMLPHENMQVLKFTKNGQRKVDMAPGAAMPGTGFLSTAPISQKTSHADSYTQGTRVNLQNFYRACEASGYKQLHIQSGNPAKNKSSIAIGDSFYLSGKHMYETTNMEAFRSCRPQPSERQVLEIEIASRQREEEQLSRMQQYKAAKAVVGAERIRLLASELSTKMSRKVSGGIGFRRRMYAFYDREKNGAIGLNEFQAACFELGISLSHAESVAIFGTCDVKCDGKITYYEFLDAFLPNEAEELGKRDVKYYEPYENDDEVIAMSPLNASRRSSSSLNSPSRA